MSICAKSLNRAEKMRFPYQFIFTQNEHVSIYMKCFFCTTIHFETEAQDNLEIAYCIHCNYRTEITKLWSIRSKPWFYNKHWLHLVHVVVNLFCQFATDHATSNHKTQLTYFNFFMLSTLLEFHVRHLPNKLQVVYFSKNLKKCKIIIRLLMPVAPTIIITGKTPWTWFVRVKDVCLNTERSYITRLRCSACQSQIPTDGQCSHLIGLFTQV